MTPPLTLLHVVGTRPNFIKIAPLLRALDGSAGRAVGPSEAVGDPGAETAGDPGAETAGPGTASPADGPAGGSAVRNVLIHTGQHYDANMSDSFFSQLRIPEPDRSLGVGSGSHAEMTGQVMMALEPVLEEVAPDLVVVVGDVNSTVAAALTAAKLHIPVAHVEAGLRSGDRAMPEELNRLLTDQLSDLLFTPSPDGDENLRREGIPEGRIRRVGNIMIDTLGEFRERARALEMTRRHDLEPGGYALATLHRPSNVDRREQLAELFAAFEEIAGEMPLLLPLHPRTRERARRFGLSLERVRVTEPIGYLEMLGLMESAGVVLTDSGGIQEETTALGVPCLTLRPNTERPITIAQGTNRLVPERTREKIVEAFREALASPPEGRRPDLWDGKTAGRIADCIRDWARDRTGGRPSRHGA